MTGAVMHRLYCVSLRWGDAGFVPEQADAMLSTVSDDWIRFNGLTWFVWSDMQKSDMAKVLQPVVGARGNVLVFAVQPEVAIGWADQWVWDWINDKMDRQIRTLP